MPIEIPVGSSLFELQFRLVTENRRLLCRANAAHRRLVDLLNAHAERAMLVQVECAPSKAGEGANANDSTITTMCVNTREILFGMPIEVASAAPSRKPPYWTEKDKWRTVIGIGPYEIVGNVHLPKGAWQREEALTEIAGFFAVTEATIRRLGGLPAPERVVIVNSARIDVIMYESAESEIPLPNESAVTVDC